MSRQDIAEINLIVEQARRDINDITQAPSRRRRDLLRVRKHINTRIDELQRLLWELA